MEMYEMSTYQWLWRSIAEQSFGGTVCLQVAAWTHIRGDISRVVRTLPLTGRPQGQFDTSTMRTCINTQAIQREHPSQAQQIHTVAQVMSCTLVGEVGDVCDDT